MNIKKNLFTTLLGPLEGSEKHRYPFRYLCFIAVMAFITCMFLEYNRISAMRFNAPMEYNASKLAQQAMDAIRMQRSKLGIAIDSTIDPNETGMLGIEYSDLTTTVGSLRAKRTSTNPNFAGLIVRWLQESGIQKGDNIAISLSGSFPALNISTLAACQILEVRPHVISSVGSSNYGANIPGLTWPDMENILTDQNIIFARSFAISLGGIVESGGGIDGKGMEIAMDAINRHTANFLKEGDYRSVETDVINRKKLFDAQGEIKAFINVGGSLTSLGWLEEIVKINSGVINTIRHSDNPNRGLIFRYIEDNIHVVHLLNIERVAEKYNFPVDKIPQPIPEEPSLYRYNVRLLLLMLVIGAWMLIIILVTRLEYGKNIQT